MAAVVFMRGVNVGGRRSFRPTALAKELSGLGLVNIGAAGTFVVRGSVTQATLRAELGRRLPFEAELMICRARDVLDLASAEPFSRLAPAKGVRRFMSVLARRPRTELRLPVSHPSGRAWQVKVVGIHSRFVLSLWRRTGKTMVYPNEVVEQRLAIPATTRSWDTITKIQAVLRRA